MKKPAQCMLRFPTRGLAAVLAAALAAIPAALAATAPPAADSTPAASPHGLNVLDQPLQPCNTRLRAGYARDGYCTLSAQDEGVHGVCAVMSRRFLDYTRAQGNDLITPDPAKRFPGLKPGDRWCVCAGRWQQALDAGVAPKVVLAATSREVLDTLFLDDLQRHALHAHTSAAHHRSVGQAGTPSSTP